MAEKSKQTKRAADGKTQKKTPEELLTALTFDELVDTSMRLDLPAPDGGPKRALAQTIADRVRAEPQLLRACLGLHAVDALLEQRKITGQTRTATWTCPLWMANDDADLRFALEELRYFGMARRTRSGWILADELPGLLRMNAEMRRALEADQQLYEVLRSVVPMYGILSAPQLVRVMDALESPESDGDAPDAGEKAVILLSIWIRREGMYGLMPDPNAGEEQSLDDLLVLDPEVSHGAALYELHRQMRAAGQSERLWKGDELASVLDTDLFITAEAGHQLQALCRELQPDPEELADAFVDAVYALRDGDRSEALLCLEDGFSDTELTTSQRWILSRILDKIPLPQLMGHTIDEANRFTVAEGLRIRPGDPCPCGSGRRYGKCHGRLH